MIARPNDCSMMNEWMDEWMNEWNIMQLCQDSGKYWTVNLILADLANVALDSS